MADKKIDVVTGGNKGVSYGACRLLAEAGVREGWAGGSSPLRTQPRGFD